MLEDRGDDYAKVKQGEPTVRLENGGIGNGRLMVLRSMDDQRVMITFVRSNERCGGAAVLLFPISFWTVFLDGAAPPEPSRSGIRFYDFCR